MSPLHNTRVVPQQAKFPSFPVLECLGPAVAQLSSPGARFTKYATCKLQFATWHLFLSRLFWHISLIQTTDILATLACDSQQNSRMYLKFLCDNHLWNVTLPKFDLGEDRARKLLLLEGPQEGSNSFEVKFLKNDKRKYFKLCNFSFYRFSPKHTKFLFKNYFFTWYNFPIQRSPHLTGNKVLLTACKMLLVVEKRGKWKRNLKWNCW